MKMKMKTNELNANQAEGIAKMSHTSLYIYNVYKRLKPIGSQQQCFAYSHKKKQLHKPISSQNDLARVLNVTLSLSRCQFI